MEMNGGSSASYLARVPCVPCFVLCLLRVETEGPDYQGWRGSFLLYGEAKGCELLLVSLGEGFRVGFRGVIGGSFPVENEGKGKGGGEGGVETGKGTARSMRKLCRNYPLANYPLVSPLLLFQQEPKPALSIVRWNLRPVLFGVDGVSKN